MDIICHYYILISCINIKLNDFYFFSNLVFYINTLIQRSYTEGRCYFQNLINSNESYVI